MTSARHPVADITAPAGWYKSSYSGGSNGECIEVASGCSVVPVRDSKDTRRPALVFSFGGWSTFVEAVKTGELAN